jgi:3-hydroxy acid dehydrogenase / malonic semialdehyde reductase
MSHWTFISGATAGIGRATAERLSRTGHHLILNGRRKERLEELKSQLEEFGHVEIANFDIADPVAVDQWFLEHQDLSSKVSVLINNAGLARGVAPIQKGNLKNWDEMINTNLRGLLHLTQKCLPSIIQHHGHVVNIGSVAGRWTYPGGNVYSATKFAVRALSESMRIDLLGTGVRVTNIEPGMVETEFSEVRLKDKAAAQKVYEGMTPLKAEDIAETIEWALSRPSHVNIQELVIFPTDQGSVRDVNRK